MDNELRVDSMNGQSVVAKTAEAIKSDNESEIFALLDNDSQTAQMFTPFGSQTWLGYAAQIGKLKALKALEKIGLDINQGDKREGRKPICSAAANNHLEVVEYLLSKGASLDTDRSVSNPLFAAIVGNSKETIELLLKAGIDASIRYNSKTMENMDALAFAIMRGCSDGANLIANHIANGDVSIAENLLLSAREIAEKNAYK